MLNVKLKVVGGDAKTTQINLKLPTIIGRSKEATLTLPHPLVSRNHCELFEKDHKLWVKDLDSLNGTFIDNVRLGGAQILGPKQLLTIGNVTFRAVYGVESDNVTDDGRDEASFAKAGDSSKAFAELETEGSANEVQFQEIDQSESIHKKRTKVDDRKRRLASIEETVFVPSDTPPINTQKTPSSQKVMGSKKPVEENKIAANGTQNATANASIIAALADVVDNPHASFSLSALDELAFNENRTQPKADVSSVDIHDDTGGTSGQVGHSFLDVVKSENGETSFVSPDDSSLDSFIRKLPK